MRRRLCDREEQRFKIRIDLMKMREDVAFFRFYLTSLDCATAGSMENYPLVICTLDEHKAVKGI
ncbi:hypothetical protein Hdeb2414_s0023g00644311 [Helianthus debilis subsp. tardiflorus]